MEWLPGLIQSVGRSLHQESSSLPTPLQPAMRIIIRHETTLSSFFDPRDNMKQMDKRREGFLLYRKQAGR